MTTQMTRRLTQRVSRGQEAHPELQEGSVGPSGGPRVVGRPN